MLLAGAALFDSCCKHNKGFCIDEYCKKEIISDKKHSARTERSINIGKKTIQVSNFHNAAETDVNLTGRKQILIQKSRCLFFDGKTAHYLRKYFKPYRVRFNFPKKEKKFFSFEKDLERNEKFCRFVFRKRKGFLFYVQPNGKKSPYTFYRKVIVAENGIYSKGVKSVDTRTKFPYN